MIFSDLVIIWSMSISRDLSSHHSFSLFSSSYSFSSFFSSSFSSFSSSTEARLSLLRLLWYSSIGTKQPSSQSNIVPFGLKSSDTEKLAPKSKAYAVCEVFAKTWTGRVASYRWGLPGREERDELLQVGCGGHHRHLGCAGGHHPHLDEHHHSCGVHYLQKTLRPLQQQTSSLSRDLVPSSHRW